MAPFITETSFTNTPDSRPETTTAGRGNDRFSFKVVQLNGETVTKHYHSQDTVARLLFETGVDNAEFKPDILVISLYTQQKMIATRRTFYPDSTFEQVLTVVREMQAPVANSYVILSLHVQQYSAKVFFNSFVRSFLGLPFRSMIFYLQSRDDSVEMLAQRVRQQLGLSGQDSRFWLFANYASLRKVHKIPGYEPVLEMNQESKCFFQFQFTDEAATSLMSTIKCGYLLMKRKKLFDVIERRWCSLSPNTLTYCRSPGEKIIKQLKGLQNARIYLLDEPKHVEEGLLYGVSIVVPINTCTSERASWLSKLFGRKKLKFSLYSYSYQEILEWRAAIEEAQNPARQNSTIREIEVGTPMLPIAPPAPRSPGPVTRGKLPANKDDYADIESIYSLFDAARDEAITDQDLNDNDTAIAECFVCKGICVNPIKLEGDYPIHPDCFLCYRCKNLPIDYVIVSEDDVVNPSEGLEGEKVFVVCTDCYRDHYSPQCSICMRNIYNGSLERKGKLYHATCYFSHPPLNDKVPT